MYIISEAPLHLTLLKILHAFITVLIELSRTLIDYHSSLKCEM